MPAVLHPPGQPEGPLQLREKARSIPCVGRGDGARVKRRLQRVARGPVLQRGRNVARQFADACTGNRGFVSTLGLAWGMLATISS